MFDSLFVGLIFALRCCLLVADWFGLGISVLIVLLIAPCYGFRFMVP